MSHKRDILFERISAWNMERNGLVYNHALEVKLLTEEIGEALTAPNKAERLRECADFYFVSAGTFAKVEKAGVEGEQQSEELMMFIYENGGICDEILESDGTDNLIWDALEIVCNANDKKPKDPTTGKVVKGPDYIDPIWEIEELIKGDAANAVH